MRVNSGISNLDKLVDGGIPRGNMVLISGDYGTGKTTMGLQFIVNGIVDEGEFGVFVTFMKARDEVSEMGKQFGWQLKRFEREGTFEIIAIPPKKWIGLREAPEDSVESFVDEIVDTVDDLGADRLVLDSSNELLKLFESETKFKTQVARLRKELRDRNCTSILISKGKAHIEELVDGVLILHYDGGLEKTRGIEVRKMRMSSHTDRMCPLEIGKKGIVVTGPPEERN